MSLPSGETQLIARNCNDMTKTGSKNILNALMYLIVAKFCASAAISALKLSSNRTAKIGPD